MGGVPIASVPGESFHCSDCLDSPFRNHDVTAWALMQSFGLRQNQVALAGMAVALLGVAVPTSSQAHHPPAGPVSDHLEEDFVFHSRAKERRLERRTARITAPDVAVAQRRAPDDPGQVGQWGPVVDWPVVGVHVALLTNGKVVAYDSVGDRATETYPVHNFTRATVWDPQTGIQTPATVTTGFNIFCSGLAHLMDGTLFTAGGNKDSSLNGITQTHLFNQSSNTWTRGADMAAGRWYPTVTPLRDGEMLITEGGPDVPEVRQNDGIIRRLTSASLNQPLYPWMDVAPDGRAFYSGPDNRMASLNPSGTGAWQMHGARDGADRDYGSHAMYDIGKILVAGGGNSLASARTINLNGASPQVSTTGSMATGRRQHNLTVLADGTVLATGGNSSGAGLVDMNNGVYAAELWNPATGTWRTLASEQVTRQYHSTALLLPDGRVLSSGGGICGACDSQGYLAKNAQVFSPPYLFKKDGSGDLAARPTITSAPGAVSYNSDFTIGTPAPSSIGKVAMVRLGAVTHSVNMEQRYVPLSFTAGGGNLTATAPLNANIAPPGYYMLFVIGTDGVPSVSTMVRVENDTAAPAAPSLTDTDPDSPANDNNPEVKGTAEAGSTVKIYSSSDCSGSPLSSGSAATFSGAGITTPVPSNQTTNLRASATDAAGNASGCSTALAYTHDASAPATPSLTDTDPDSPANDNNPEVKGTAEAGSTVKIYSSSDCSGSPLASGSAASFNGAGITTPVAGDQTTNLRATATDSVNNASGCSSALAYTEDSTAPNTQIDSGPQGPTNDPTPSFGFSATGGAQSFACRFDSGSFGPCSGPGDTHTASPQLSDGAHTFEVRATDSAQNTDSTPASRSFTVDTVAPATPSLTDTDPDSPANDNNPEVKGTAEAGSTVKIYSSSDCSGSPLASGSAATFSGAGITTPVPSNQTTNLRASATDAAGNASGCSTALAYTHDASAPATPSLTDTDPDSPANDNNPEVKGTAEAGSTVKIYSSSDCSGSPLASGSAASFNGAGITTPVAGDQTTNLRATATDSVNNASGCSSALAYTEDSTAPNTQVDSGPQGPTNDPTPSFGFSATGGAQASHAASTRPRSVPARGPATPTPPRPSSQTEPTPSRSAPPTRPRTPTRPRPAARSRSTPPPPTPRSTPAPRARPTIPPRASASRPPAAPRASNAASTRARSVPARGPATPTPPRPSSQTEPTPSRSAPPTRPRTPTRPRPAARSRSTPRPPTPRSTPAPRARPQTTTPASPSLQASPIRALNAASTAPAQPPEPSLPAPRPEPSPTSPTAPTHSRSAPPTR